MQNYANTFQVYGFYLNCAFMTYIETDEALETMLAEAIKDKVLFV